MRENSNKTTEIIQLLISKQGISVRFPGNCVKVTVAAAVGRIYPLNINRYLDFQKTF
jgi:hypothetical protein